MRQTVKAVQVKGSKVVANREWQELTVAEAGILAHQLQQAGWFVQVITQE